MGHPYLDNKTPFQVEVLQLLDEHGGTILVPIVKATFDIVENALALAEEQHPVDTSGVHWGDPDSTAYMYEPETAFHKPTTDIVLVGCAYPVRRGDTQRDIAFQVANQKKTLRVTGDRIWYRSVAGIAATKPLTFEKIPLSYDRAYGGWDRTHRDSSKHHCDERNPVGRGYRAPGARFQESSALPNVEDPGRPLESYDAKGVPAGVGFVGPSWQPRVRLGGTYDERWAEQRSPLLPTDFRRAFFNAASAGLIAQSYLRGNESVLVHGTQPGSTPITFRLPGIALPACTMIKRSRAQLQLETSFDTLIVDTERRQVLLLWRAHANVPEGLQGVADVTFSCANAPAARSHPGRGKVIPLRVARPLRANL